VKTESIEEFLKRGGQVKKLAVEETNEVLSCKEKSNFAKNKEAAKVKRLEKKKAK
jgi:hypothetical protein